MRFATLVAALALLQIPSARGDDMVEDVGDFLPTYFAELQDVERDGDKAYVFGVGGLAIMNIEDPANPFMMGRYIPPADPFERIYRGTVDLGHAYAGAREDGLWVIDVFPFSDPVLTTVIGEPGVSYEGSAVDGNLLFACRHADGLEILDVSGPGYPVPVAEVTELVNSWDAAARDGWVFVADGLGGLAVIDVRDPTAPLVAAIHETAGVAVDVTLHDDLALVAMGSAGVELIDVSEPAAPVPVGSYDSSGLAITIDTDGDLLYIADWDDLEVVDIGDPAAPVLVGREETPVRAMGLAAADGLAYVADWSRLRIYRHGPTSAGDISAPLALEFGDVPDGVATDSTITIANTGGGTLTVTEVISFDPLFEVLPPASFTVPPGGEHPVTIRYHNTQPGYDTSVLRIDSDDRDEPRLILPLSGEPDPHDLDLGEPAIPFSLYDIEGTLHRLQQYRGRVVVLAFFANW